MKYLSTRNASLSINSSQAILKGLSEDSGLFIYDKLDFSLNLEKMIEMNYEQIAFEIMSHFLNDFHEKDIKESIQAAYRNFDDPEITPLVKVDENYILELFHGPTSAFKDVALQILPHLLRNSMEITQNDNEIIILTATSGDTGKAALEGFKDIDHVKIIVFYPYDGVSEIQKRQMQTTKGNNVFVIGINGNFDDCQKMVKACFSDEKLKQVMTKNHQQFSSANSINIGRLIPQIVYYVKGYLDLVKNHEIEMNEKINVAVPTGNFGNILAAYIAKQIGCPIEKLICASNENNVLTDFIHYGVYNANRTFKKTNSPSMDIIVSSNLERLLYLYCQDDELVENMMESLTRKGSYQLSDLMHKKLKKDFYASMTTQKQTQEIIQEVYEQYHYLLDPHSAVAYKAVKDFEKEKINSYKTMICATASPYKFMDTVMKSISSIKGSEFDMMEACEKMTGVPIPENLKNLKNFDILHDQKIEIEQMKETVYRCLGEQYD